MKNSCRGFYAHRTQLLEINTVLRWLRYNIQHTKLSVEDFKEVWLRLLCATSIRIQVLKTCRTYAWNSDEKNITLLTRQMFGHQLSTIILWALWAFNRFSGYTDGNRNHGHLAMRSHARCHEQLCLGYGSRDQRMKMRQPGSGCEIRARRRRRFCELRRVLAQNLSWEVYGG